MFEQASRIKLRFDTAVGVLNVEDLWDLPLTSSRGISLDDIARSAHRQIKGAETESFVVKTTSANATLQLSFDIVKHIIDVKLAEKEAALAASANREKKQRILAIIADKKDEQLKGAPLEELEALAATL